MKKKFLFLIALTCAFLQLHAAKPLPLTTNYAENDYTGNWGRLKLNGTCLVSQCGDTVQLKGWSTHGWQFGDVGKVTFSNKNGIEGMKSMGANVVRVAAYPSPYSQVNSDGTMRNIISWVKNCMKWTHELNMYCIVDYHVLNPGRPLMYLNDGGLGRDAEDFFQQIMDEVREKGYKHIIYEICNEPDEKAMSGVVTSINTITSWDNVKEYAARILPVIGSVDPKAVVIVGTPTYDQRLDYAAGVVGSGRLTLPAEYPNLNIMYAFHYYSCTHHSVFNSYLKKYAGEIPVFVSEWSATAANGTGTCANSYPNATEFLDFLKNNHISWTAWSWSSKSEASAALKARSVYNTTYTYTEDDLSEMGQFVTNALQKGDFPRGCDNISSPDIKNIRFGIYPNPAKDGVFTVSLEDNRLTTISISNVQGKMVYSSTIEDKNAVINTNLKTGVYIVTVKNENGTGTQKLVVE